MGLQETVCWRRWERVGECGGGAGGGGHRAGIRGDECRVVGFGVVMVVFSMSWKPLRLGCRSLLCALDCLARCVSHSA